MTRKPAIVPILLLLAAAAPAQVDTGTGYQIRLPAWPYRVEVGLAGFRSRPKNSG